MGQAHLQLDEPMKTRLFGPEEERRAFCASRATDHVHITPQELFGLKAIIMYIHALPVSKKCVPSLIGEPINLVRDVRAIVDQHRNDSAELAVTGTPLLHWPGVKNDLGYMKMVRPKIRREGGKKDLGRTRTPRTHCRICQGCTGADCGTCVYCVDMPKFGGPGKLRQPCKSRHCMQPLLVHAAVCSICGLDGWYAETNMRLIE
jgi:F-box/leucine-rich repeat protein 10/11